ncbi:glycosyltransferase family 2 protein [Joostella sp.]|uniref:glycosyltransferase family 2 protein n=1 Tax=Joostella sp. TaxID=2231138 RepID=UPI003A92228B
MVNNKIISVVLPAYNAEKTLINTFQEIPLDIVDNIILTDDKSIDNTVAIAKKLGIKNIIQHKRNSGYGANQKTCYNKALELNSDIVIMLHPDYQYSPKLIKPIIYMILSGHYDVILGSRIISTGALKGGMPIYKYIFNRALTLFQNILLGQKLSEYHTGYRAFTKEVLESINFNSNSNDFIFDNEILSQIIYKKFIIGEISCPVKYEKDSSSINFKRSVIYGFGVIRVSILYFLSKHFYFKSKIFIFENNT